MAIGAGPATEHRWLAGSRADPTVPSGPWIKQPQEVCTTRADTITDQLPARSDLEELAKLCQQIDRACRIMYELSDPRPGLEAERTAFRNRLLDERRARLRDLVGQLDATSARLCKMPD